jgi:hypothetical protein
MNGSWEPLDLACERMEASISLCFRDEASMYLMSVYRKAQRKPS